MRTQFRFRLQIAQLIYSAEAQANISSTFETPYCRLHKITLWDACDQLAIRNLSYKELCTKLGVFSTGSLKAYLINGEPQFWH
jgi:hypothetical protein